MILTFKIQKKNNSKNSHKKAQKYRNAKKEQNQYNSKTIAVFLTNSHH